MQLVEESGDSISRGRLLVPRRRRRRSARSASRSSHPPRRSARCSHGPSSGRRGGAGAASWTSTAARCAPTRSSRRSSTPRTRSTRTARSTARRSIVVRLDPRRPRPAAGAAGTGRRAGIVAYSKICTHAGCAVSLYRVPTFAPVEPKPALVCPCHYSTFDPAKGGGVLFGPAGRPLPQLPLADRLERRCSAPPATSPARSARPGGASATGGRSRDREARPLRSTSARRRRRTSRRRCATSSPTTGRSCSARSRSTRSSLLVGTGIYLTLFFDPSVAHHVPTRLVRAAARPGGDAGVRVGRPTSRSTSRPGC